MKKKKSNIGRPTVMTEKVLDKLQEAFMMGCSDTEACLYANIATDTLYKYQREHPDFIKRKEELKEKPILDARKTLATAVKSQPQYALEYLKRKKKLEFGDHVDVTSGNKPLPIYGGISRHNSNQKDLSTD